MDRRTYIKQTTLLLGYMVSTAAVSDLLIFTRRTAKHPWKPVFLSPTQANTLAEITETICPKTDTPGAIELGVPQFIDKMLKDLLTETDQKDFLYGLEQLDARCVKEYDKSFTACDQKQREALLTTLDRESPKFPPNMWGIVLVEKPAPITFFRKMKSLTLMAYFTSEKIGKEVLVFDPIPGKYVGCIPYNNQNSWTE